MIPISEIEYKYALKVVATYEKQLKEERRNNTFPRWRCLLCGRDRFDRKQAHRCNGQMRGRGLIWEKIETLDTKMKM